MDVYTNTAEKFRYFDLDREDNKMNQIHLKESAKHGDELFPVKSYDYTASPQKTPMNCHWHTEFEFFKMVSGQIRLQYKNEYRIAKAGDMFFFNSGELHAATNIKEEPVRFHSIVFHPDIISSMDAIRMRYINPIIDGEFILVHDLCKNVILQQKFDTVFGLLKAGEFGYELEVKSLLCSMFFEMMKDVKDGAARSPKRSSMEHIKNAIGYIDKNYMNPIRTDELASVCFLSTGYFCRLFKRVTFKTPWEYLNEVRLSHAVELLVYSDKRIVDVALEVGFSSNSYFIEAFKTAFGIPPGEYRKKHRN